MYKLVTVEDTIRIPPRRFNEDLNFIIVSELNNTIVGRVEKDVGILLAVTEVKKVSEGKIILGDGAVYYDAVFEVLVYQPELHEVIIGIVTEATDFGAFVNFGPIDGLIHVSQMTEDFMTYDQKNASFVGKETKKVLKKGDTVIARIVTISMKDKASDSKIGLTMRQPYLGKLEWLEQEKVEKGKKAEKEKGAKVEKERKPKKGKEKSEEK